MIHSSNGQTADPRRTVRPCGGLTYRHDGRPTGLRKGRCTVIPECKSPWWDRFPRTLRDAHTFATDAVVQAAFSTEYLGYYGEKQSEEDRGVFAKVFAASIVYVFDANVALSWSLYSLGNEFSTVARGIERFQDCVAPSVHALVHYLTFGKFRQTYNGCRRVST